jgi:outer membrane protein OmpA-like peptidoglycan-associated protein
MTSTTSLIRSFIVLCLTLLTVGELRAHEEITNDSTGRKEYLQFFAGGYAGLGVNLHTANFGALSGVPSCCPEYRDATSLFPSLGALIEIPITSLFRIEGRVGYASIGGTLESDEVIGNEPVLDDGPVPTPVRKDVTVKHVLEASIPMIVVEPTLGVRLFNNFWVNGGVRFGVMVAKGFDQSETLYSPEGYTFLDGSAVRNQVSQDIPQAQTLQMHGSFALRYELFVSKRVSIVPEARYYVPLTNVSDVDWAVQTFQMGAGIRYGIYAPRERIEIKDTVTVRDTMIVEKSSVRSDRLYLAETTESESHRDEGDYRYTTTTFKEQYILETPKPFSPGLSVDFVAIENDVRRQVDSVRIEELDVIENFPLLPQIFYDSSSAEATRSKQYLLNEEQARDFRLIDLARNQIEVYRHMLNIVGHRMNRQPASRLTITGCTDNTNEELNNRELAQQRADQVKDYLVKVWRVEPNRIITKARLLPEQPANPRTEDGRAENRRVELESDDPTLLEPVEFKDRDLNVSPTDYRLNPSVVDFSDIAEWDVTIAQGANQLYAESGKGRPTPVRWDAGNNGSRPRTDKPVVGTVTVRNAIGQTKSAADTLSVDYVTLQLMKSREEGGKLIERYSLIVFDYNSAKLNASNQRVMERVRSRIEPESKVTIIGYADRQGNPEYNRNLAERRCKEAQRVLGLSDSRVTIKPIGSDQLIYDNDTPEGRSYSRTVQIEIETPLR